VVGDKEKRKGWGEGKLSTESKKGEAVDTGEGEKNESRFSREERKNTKSHVMKER